MPKTILEMKNISKSFDGVQALKNVNFSCYENEVHVLAGENGAGKSTILKVLAGLFRPTEGEIEFYGEKVIFKSTYEAQNKKIAMVFQELSLIPELTVLENIFLNREPMNRLHRIDVKKERKILQKYMDEYDIHVDPDALVKKLPIAQQQMVEILKILMKEPRLIILDEPTSSLSKKEVNTLYKIIRTLTNKNKTIIFISHRMEEVFEIGDRVTVLKDGTYVGTKKLSEINEDELINMMVGRKLSNIFPERNQIDEKEVVFEVNNLKLEKDKNPISFKVYKGEILGIAGLEGHGQTELLNAISGLYKNDGANFYINGKEKNIQNCKKALKEGIALVPGDRKTQGLLLNISIKHNMALASLDKRSSLGIINSKREREFAENMVEKLHIKIAGIDKPVSSLSGGNQQKVVLGKELAVEPKVLLFNEPTRGIDVKAKQDFYYLMKDLAARGTAVIMYSSDLMEVIGMSSRVLVMYEKDLSGIIDHKEISEERIMKYAMGISKE